MTQLSVSSQYRNTHISSHTSAGTSANGDSLRPFVPDHSRGFKPQLTFYLLSTLPVLSENSSNNLTAQENASLASCSTDKCHTFWMSLWRYRSKGFSCFIGVLLTRFLLFLYPRSKQKRTAIQLPFIKKGAKVMKRVLHIFVIFIALSCWLNVANAQTVYFQIEPGTSETPVVGELPEYRVLIRDAENVTGFNLRWYPAPQGLVSPSRVGYFEGTTYDFLNSTFDAPDLVPGPSIRNVAIFQFTTISAGLVAIHIVGTLTTTQGIVDVDIQFPIKINPSDVSNPFPANGRLVVVGSVDNNAPGLKSVGVPLNYTLEVSDARFVAGYDVEVTYSAKILGPATIIRAGSIRGATATDSTPPGKIKLRASGPQPQAGYVELAKLQFTPIKAGRANIRITQATLKNSPTDTPGTVLGANDRHSVDIKIVGKRISNVRVISENTQLTVTWNPVKGATSYQVELFPGWPKFKKRVQGPATRATLGNLTNGTEYTAWVSAYKADGSLLAVARKGVKGTPSLPQAVVHLGSAQRSPMYWIEEAGTLHRLINDEVENILPNVQNATSLALDTTEDKIYWTTKSSKIYRANLNGTGTEELAWVFGIPYNIAVNATGNKFYWTDDRGRVQSANLNGKQIKNIAKNLETPSNITLDTAGGKLYWTETSGRIWRANLNGKSSQAIATGLGPISGIAISGNRLYWTEVTGEDSGKIGGSDLDGSNLRTLATLRSAPANIAVDPVDNKLYWTDSSGNIRRANLNGKSIKKIVSGLVSPLIGFALGSSNATAAAAPTLSSGTSTPDTTRLFANYPNPFNPETWIPYQLAEPSDVKITIYDARGSVIRQLNLGHQFAGMYTSQSRAVYWDGRNTQGERVASGIYFYQLQTDNVSSLRKMLILK